MEFESRLRKIESNDANKTPYPGKHRRRTNCSSYIGRMRPQHDAKSFIEYSHDCAKCASTTAIHGAQRFGESIYTTKCSHRGSPPTTRFYLQATASSHPLASGRVTSTASQRGDLLVITNTCCDVWLALAFNRR